jgi:hypothetical protein
MDAEEHIAATSISSRASRDSIRASMDAASSSVIALAKFHLKLPNILGR